MRLFVLLQFKLIYPRPNCLAVDETFKLMMYEISDMWFEGAEFERGTPIVCFDRI